MHKDFKLYNKKKTNEKKDLLMKRFCDNENSIAFKMDTGWQAMSSQFAHFFVCYWNFKPGTISYCYDGTPQYTTPLQCVQ